MNCRVQQLDNRFLDYLRDESGATGRAESICFPKDTNDVLQVISQLKERRVTVQGSRTGLFGHGVPDGGHILNLSAMDRVLGMERDGHGGFLVRVQPGLTLDALNRQLAGQRFNTGQWDGHSLSVLSDFQNAGPHFWPPDPTEPLASVGGMAATNARGLLSHGFGRTRRHITRICLADPKGRRHRIDKGQYISDRGMLPLPWGEQIPVEPDHTDLLDLVLGSCGSLGVICEMTLQLMPRPKAVWGIVFFFPGPDQAAEFIREIKNKETGQGGVRTASIEFMDRTTLGAVSTVGRKLPRFKGLPEPPSGAAAAVFLELHGSREEPVEEMGAWLLENAAAQGSDPDESWAGSEPVETEKIRLLRQAAPSAVHALADEMTRKDGRIRRVAADVTFPDVPLPDMLKGIFRRCEGTGLKPAVFGHAADSLLHVYLLPQGHDPYMKGCDVMERRIGLDREQWPLSGLTPAAKALKHKLDPDQLWNIRVSAPGRDNTRPIRYEIFVAGRKK